MDARISVIVITYNQEAVIRRTIDSLLGHKDFLHEICISDDCSKDGTPAILQEYTDRFPDLIKISLNKENVGIFANIEFSRTLATGNLIYELAGDDIVPQGYFSAICDYCEKNGIDPDEGRICFYGDDKVIYPDGKEIMLSNKMISSTFPAEKLKLRSLISTRSVCFSRMILEDFVPVHDGRSYSVEEAQDIQVTLFSEKNIYLPMAGSVYFAEYGVSSSLSEKTRFERTMMYDKLDWLMSFLGRELDDKDKRYVKFLKEYATYNYDHKFATLARSAWYYISAFDPALGIKGLGMNRIKNAIARRLKKVKPW